MIVRCENCQTEFSLDKGQVTPEGITVRCSLCAFVFRVDPVRGGLADQPWQIHTVEDLLFTAPDLVTLQQWIEEGRLHPDDQVSRSGKNWLRLGDMAEFSSAFVGYGDLPPVLKTLQSGLPLSQVADAERSAVDELGPPPVFAGGEDDNAETSTVERSLARASEQHRDGAHPSVSSLESAPSMLSAVTQHAVTPIVASKTEKMGVGMLPPAIAQSPERSSVDDGRPRPVARGDFAAAADSWKSGTRPAFAGSGQARSGYRRNGGRFAGLGVIAAIGILFGIPENRTWMLSLGRSPETSVPARSEDQAAVGARLAIPFESPAIDAAESLMLSLGAAEISAAEGRLQAEIDTGKHPAGDLAALRIAQADVLATRSLLRLLEGSLEGADADRLRAAANRDLDHAARVFDSILGENNSSRARLVRSRIRLAEGRPSEDIEGLLPQEESEGGVAEMRAVIAGAMLWRASDSPVPDALVPTLRGLQRPTALGLGMLAVALIRSGEDTEARELVDRLLGRAGDQQLALALQKILEGKRSRSGEGRAKGDETDGFGRGQETEAQERLAATKKSSRGTKDTNQRRGGSAPAGARTLDALIDRGCGQVEKGQAARGIATLSTAFDMDPHDLDVLVCLGQGHHRQGNSRRALHFFDLALRRSPRHRLALTGAAATAEKMGARAKASALYKRLLAVDPSNGAARTYLSQERPTTVEHGASASP